MLHLTNNIAKKVLDWRFKRIEGFKNSSHSNQKNTFRYLITQLAQTKYGKAHGIKSNTKLDRYKSQVPIVSYEDIAPLIQDMIMGEKDVLWPGVIRWYAKSSGTTNDKSKYIPIPYISLRKNHIAGTKDTMSLIYKRKPDCGAFGAKSIIMGGSLTEFDKNPKAMAGDVSAIMTYHMPAVGRPFFGMDFKTALIDDWELKINRITSQCAHKDVRMIGGVPTWTIVLIENMLKHYGADNILDIWENLEVYIHGGVGFDPYLQQFQNYIPKEDFLYHEVYNASEGYIASQDIEGEGMLLFTDNHMFYEFMPLSEWGKGSEAETIGLEEVEIGPSYGLILSSSSGLWRYVIGDTVSFLSKDPYRIKVSGRLQQYINVFGEELMVKNTEMALAEAVNKHDAIVREYSVGPVFMREPGHGGHEWLIEFDKKPRNLERFADDLDEAIQNLNSDYAAKRYKNMALQRLKIESLPKNTFINWLKYRGKYGGQNKVPRLSNNRKVLDDIHFYLENLEPESSLQD